MTFSSMLENLKLGRKIVNTNPTWPYQFIAIQHPINDPLLTEPFIFAHTLDHDIIPYSVTNRDLFSDRWEIKVQNNPTPKGASPNLGSEQEKPCEYIRKQ